VSVRSVCASAAIVLLVLFAGLPVQAEDDPILPGDGPQVLELSLARALALGAEANIGLQEASYAAPIAWQGRVAADAMFDTLLTADANAARVQTPSTFSFLGVGTITDENFNASVGLSRMLRSGGSVSLLYRYDRLDAGNPLALFRPAVTNGVSLEATQPLMRGAGDIALADVRRAQNDVVAAKAGYRTTLEVTLLTIAERYWDLVFAFANLDARLKSEEVAQELLDNALARQKAEVGTPLDVAQARAGLERRRSEVLEAENLRDTMQDQLLMLILPFGPEVREAIRVSPTDTPGANSATLPSRDDVRRYVDLAIKGRPEMIARRAEISTAGIDVKVAHDAIRPRLDVVGRVSTDGLDNVFGDSLGKMLDGQAVSGAIGLQFSLFLGQRGAKASWLAAAWRRRQATLRQRDLENSIVVEVRAALRDLDTARGQYAAGSAEVTAAEEGLRGERLKLDRGKSTPFRVLQQEEDLTSARQRVSRAAADLSIAEARLYRSVGSMAERYSIDTSKWEDCCGTGR